MPRGPLDVKVPASITVLFWFTKLITTGTGEATSDFLGTGPIVLTGALAAAAFIAAMAWQLRSRRYRAGVYWLAVTMIAVVGTVAADGVHVALGVPYAVSTAAWAIVVAGVLTWWRHTEGTLSIHSINTRRRERFYWATVLATFALGTAAGDLTAAQLGLGFLPSVALFGGLILVPAVLWRAGVLGSVAAFWTSYILTRPLGASIADWLGKPHSVGHGLGYGDGTVAIVGLLTIVPCVALQTWKGRRWSEADEFATECVGTEPDRAGRTSTP